jgi:hypothetical protein
VTKSYRDALTTGFASRIPTPVNPASHGGVHMASTKHLVQQAGTCDEGFTMGSRRRGGINRMIFPILGHIEVSQLWSDSGALPASL